MPPRGLGLAWLGSLGPMGGMLSSPQNFNLVCLGCFSVEAEEPKPRLNMRDKRPANRLSLAVVGGAGGGLGWRVKQQPTDTAPFFPWIRDLVPGRVRQPQNNGVIQSWGRLPARTKESLRVFQCVCLSGLNTHRTPVMFDHVRSEENQVTTVRVYFIFSYLFFPDSDKKKIVYKLFFLNNFQRPEFIWKSKKTFNNMCKIFSNV